MVKPPDNSATSWRKPLENPTQDLDCDICGHDLEIREDDSDDTVYRKKNHYMVVCSAIPGKPVIASTESSTKDTVARVAALGTIKRLGKVDIVRDLRENPLSSRSLSANSDVYISIKEKPPDEIQDVQKAQS